MGYKKESNDRDSRYDLDWVVFPDEQGPDREPDDSETDDLDDRADDLSLVNRLESLTRRHIHRVEKAIKNEKDASEPASLWKRILFHVPKNNRQSFILTPLYFILMIVALVLLVYSLKLIF